MRFRRLKEFIALTLSVLFSLSLGAWIKGANTLRLSDISGARTFYLYTASSQALMKKELSFFDLFHVRGESVELTGTNVDERFVQELVFRYGGEILFLEEASGCISYYCFTPKFSGGVCVNGQRVNLHVAIGNGRGVVGSPIIFGGF